MARPKKDGIAVTVNLERSIWQRLDDFSKDFGQSKTVAIERALDKYLKSYEDDGA